MALTSQHILLNGNFHSETSTLFNLFNRALRYGDCITETIHSCASRLCFFDEHLQNLCKAMKVASMNVPTKFANWEKEFTKEVAKMLTKNRVFKGATVKLMVFRSSLNSNPTLPDPIEYLAYIESLSDTLAYELNERGLSIDVLEGISKSTGPLSNYDTHDSQIYKTMALKKCATYRLNDIIMLNHKGNVVETARGCCVFIKKDNMLMTPPLTDGCPADVMRSKVIKAAEQIGLSICDKVPIEADMLKKAEEIFLASTENGIQWVMAYKDRRFLRTTSLSIIKIINEMYSAEE
ncbi:MAG: aminotransferase class IV [Bacteroidales bacterium]|nr:aminotransferase class IV [Bacteroidales bacterium]